jgi:hypothetical protein
MFGSERRRPCRHDRRGCWPASSPFSEGSKGTFLITSNSLAGPLGGGFRAAKLGMFVIFPSGSSSRRLPKGGTITPQGPELNGRGEIRKFYEDRWQVAAVRFTVPLDQQNPKPAEPRPSK